MTYGSAVADSLPSRMGAKRGFPAWRRAIAAAVLVVLSAGFARAEDPGTFSLLIQGDAVQPDVGLGDAVRVHIDGDTPLDTAKITLRLDGSEIGIEPRLLPDSRDLIFVLQRTEKNREMWLRLLGSPFDHDRVVPLPISIEIDGKPLLFKPGPGKKDQASAIGLISYSTTRMTIGLCLALVVLIVTVFLCWTTTIIRDSVVPQFTRADRPYSLGRFQMAVWFCIIFASFIFILTVTDDLNTITAESFILLGISGATALGSVAIDTSKDDTAILKLEAAIVDLGIKNRSDIEALRKKARIGGGKELANTVVKALPIASTSTVEDILKSYDALIEDFKSTDFVKDLINDVNGPTIHRWQILVWTLVLAGIYLWRVYVDLQAPTLGTNLLALMGISGGVYLGFKIPERQNT